MLEDRESLTDSVTSTDVEDSGVVSDSDFDLSDPEALAETSTGTDFTIINEIQETNEVDFVSGNSAVLGSLFNSESAVSVDNEDYSSTSGASFVRRLSWSGRRARGRSRGYRPRTPQRGRSGNVQSTGRGGNKVVQNQECKVVEEVVVPEIVVDMAEGKASGNKEENLTNRLDFH